MLNQRRDRFLQEAPSPLSALNDACTSLRYARVYSSRLRRHLVVPFLVVALVGCVMPSLAAAEQGQSDGASWDALTSVAVGADLRVATGGDVRVSGRLIRVSADSVTVDSAIGRVTIPRSRVASVDVRTRRRDSLRNGALIGAIAGLAYGGIGTAIAYRGGDDPPGNAVLVAGLSVAIGAGVGALADRLRGTVWVRVYRAAAQPRR